ncbi:MAG: peroxide stress protein YaaA [Bacteroidota bacterium]|nr:peroxide stress protein YaaA [Bacteroidota bacterium]
MLIIISPSKTQDFSTGSSIKLKTQPSFLAETGLLVKELKKKSVKQIIKLMDVSPQIASLNFERYKQFHTPFTPDNAKQALLAFKGDVYTDIEVDDYKKEELQFAQKHLRILSGLYGLLQPLDLIQPYRLEMKIKLKYKRRKNLYQFWGSRITELLNEDLKKSNDKVLINLASKEYFKVIQEKDLQAKVITPIFKDYKNGEYKIIAIFAKRARGMMTNYIIRNNIENVEEIKLFHQAGYNYDDNLSGENEWVFNR